MVRETGSNEAKISGTNIHSSFNKTFNNFVDMCTINAIYVSDLYSDIRLTSDGQVVCS